jgi:hypothetical protein
MQAKCNKRAGLTKDVVIKEDRDMEMMDTPRSIWEISDWIDGKISALGRDYKAMIDLAIFVGEDKSNTKVTDEKLLKWAWRCGNSLQFRRIVCMNLLTMKDAVRMVSLMEAVCQKEFLVLSDAKEGDFSDLHQTVDRGELSGNMKLFVDGENNFLYISLSSCRIFCKRPVVVIRVRLDGSFMDTHNTLLAIIEDNKKALFKPGTAPTDEESKRNWWLGRYELQNRLTVVVDKINGWLRLVVPFIFNGEVGGTCKVKMHGIVAPLGIDLSILVSAIQASNIQVADICKILKALDFAEGDIESLSTMIDGSKIPICGDPFDPFSAPLIVERCPLLISIDRYLHDFPWEACANLKDHLVLRSLGMRSAAVRAFSNISAVLNPGGDLKRTEEQLIPLLAEIQLKESIIGRAPSTNEMRDMLVKGDLVLYFGHGSGELYLSAPDIASLPSCASAFLFGCSSGRLKALGEYNPEGALLAFRSAASPLVLANLWDVTDRDIDKLTAQFLRRLPLTGVGLPVGKGAEECAEALESSRSVCLLQLLNGTAPVLFIN